MDMRLSIINSPLATGGPGPPLGLNFKLPKNGFSEAPQTSQVPRMYLWANFGQKFFDHIALLGPPGLSKRAHFAKKQRFLHLPIISCGFTSIKCVFLVRKVSFTLLLVLETLNQPKLAV